MCTYINIDRSTPPKSQCEQYIGAPKNLLKDSKSSQKKFHGQTQPPTCAIQNRCPIKVSKVDNKTPLLE